MSDAQTSQAAREACEARCQVQMSERQTFVLPPEA